MTQVSNIGNTWNLPNYAGELFSADAMQTPLLSMIGGLSGGRQTTNFEFPTAVLFDYPEAAQPSISEEAAAVAPTAEMAARSQESNVVQIHQEVINLTYAKQSNSGRMSGLNTADAEPSVADERAFQVQHKLIKIARDVEHSFINGKYQKSTASNVANKTRGLLELCSGGTTLDAKGAALSKVMLQQVFREMANNGAYFNNMVMFLPAYQKQALSEIYASQLTGTAIYLPSQRIVGGVNITELETDFCRMGICWDRFMPADSILIADVAHIAPVFQAVPGKGVLFEEELAKTGAADKIQLYGQIGLAHGPAFLHASITGLACGA
jgi:hypothetical protein